MSPNRADQAAVIRDFARRAQRLANSLTDESDKARLTRLAEELEAQAAELERLGREGGGSAIRPSSSHRSGARMCATVQRRDRELRCPVQSPVGARLRPLNHRPRRKVDSSPRKDDPARSPLTEKLMDHHHFYATPQPRPAWMDLPAIVAQGIAIAALGFWVAAFAFWAIS